jgi:hypothetical protein
MSVMMRVRLLTYERTIQVMQNSFLRIAFFGNQTFDACHEMIALWGVQQALYQPVCCFQS